MKGKMYNVGYALVMPRDVLLGDAKLRKSLGVTLADLGVSEDKKEETETPHMKPWEAEYVSPAVV